jgi:hypothetical protein
MYSVYSHTPPKRDNIKIDIQVGWEGVNKKTLAGERNQFRDLVNVAMKLLAPEPAMTKRELCSTCRKSIPDLSVVQPGPNPL